MAFQTTVAFGSPLTSHCTSKPWLAFNVISFLDTFTSGLSEKSRLSIKSHEAKTRQTSAMNHSNRHRQMSVRLEQTQPINSSGAELRRNRNGTNEIHVSQNALHLPQFGALKAAQSLWVIVGWRDCSHLFAQSSHATSLSLKSLQNMTWRKAVYTSMASPSVADKVHHPMVLQRQKPVDRLFWLLTKHEGSTLIFPDAAKSVCIFVHFLVKSKRKRKGIEWVASHFFAHVTMSSVASKQAASDDAHGAAKLLFVGHIPPPHKMSRHHLRHSLSVIRPNTLTNSWACC